MSEPERIASCKYESVTYRRIDRNLNPVADGGDGAQPLDGVDAFGLREQSILDRAKLECQMRYLASTQRQTVDDLRRQPCHAAPTRARARAQCTG